MRQWLYDTHAHLYDERYSEDREEVLRRSSEELRGWINIGADLKSSRQCLQIARDYPVSRATAGIHPHDVSNQSFDELEEIARLWEEPEVIAAGEMGLDYYYGKDTAQLQREVFTCQLTMARDKKLPCVIHVRDAFEDFFSIADQIGWHHGVVHCFTGNYEQGEQVIRRGFHVSFGGMITFRNTLDIQEAARKLPLEKILLETDSPYLTPVPYRGRRNEPRHVLLAAQRLAELRNLPLEEILKTTFENAIEVFSDLGEHS